MTAMDQELATMVEDAGKVYEKFLTPEEIERLIAIHSDPAMQKLILNQPNISKDMIPVGEAFGLRAGARFEKTLKLKAAE